MSLSASDEQQARAWWQALLREPGRLPDGLTPVQTRLVRAVARGELPDAGQVYVKAMWFPRGKDRLRYLLRPLPAVHEARLLEFCRERGILVPEVCWVGSKRRRLLPRLSMLVTAALPAVDVVAAPEAVAAVVLQLIAAGVYHPDLNLGNFLHLDDGRAAVIDLQSARRRGSAVKGHERVGMIAKMLADRTTQGIDNDAVQQALQVGGIPAAELRRCTTAATHSIHVARLGRLRRCLRESTQFRVRRGLLGTTYERRALYEKEAGDWVEGGRELFHYWLGDRALEVLEAADPVLGALYRPAPWALCRHRVYIRGGAEALRAVSDRLSQGHDRFRSIARTRVRETE